MADVSAEEKSRIAFAEKTAKAHRKAELDRREAFKKAQDASQKKTFAPLVG